MSVTNNIIVFSTVLIWIILSKKNHLNCYFDIQIEYLNNLILNDNSSNIKSHKY